MAKLYLGDTEIAPIVEVPTPEKKYGVDINAVLGNVDADGVLQYPSGTGTVDLSSVKTISLDFALTYKFYNNKSLSGRVIIGLVGDLSRASAMSNCFSYCTGLTSVDLSSLTTISGSSAISNCFWGCTGLTSVDLSSLTTVSNISAMASCFWGCTGLTSVDLSSLTTVSGSNAMANCFRDCTGLTSVDLSSLTTVSATRAMANCFDHCAGLTSVSFPSLKEILPATTDSQFSNMFSGCTALTEIHFPSNMQARVEQLTEYATQFGASNATIYFDLPSTEDA